LWWHYHKEKDDDVEKEEDDDDRRLSPCLSIAFWLLQLLPNVAAALPLLLLCIHSVGLAVGCCLLLLYG
jgi:hypothetical protein